MIRGKRWQQVKALLDEALDLPPDDRRAFLETSCAGDEALRRQVESLLEEEETAGDFLEDPIFVLASNGPGRAGDDAERRIGPYRLIRPLGRGGMGTVYLARRDDDAYRSEVAIKVIRPPGGGPTAASDELLRRFLVERQILADLDHPNIAELYDGGSIDDGGVDDGLPYLVMERIDGVPITEYCDRERLDVAARLDLFGEVCAAVQAAHRNLIVHRDIKPANILVTADAGPPEGDTRAIPKLLDFGIAKPLDPSAFPQAVETTGSWQRPMTPIYASPEQIRGEAVTTATDVYSLGVVLYELLTGRHPYFRDTGSRHDIEDAVLRTPAQRPSDAIARSSAALEQAVSSAALEQAVDSEDDPATVAFSALEVSRRRRATPRQLRRQLAGDLDNIILMALRKDPDRRYATVEQLVGDLRRHRQGLPVTARRDTAGYRVRKFVRRNRLAVVSATLVAALVVGFAIVMALLAARLKASDQRARQLADQAATLAEDLGTALDEKQQVEVERKLAEAARLSLEGESEEAERLRRDVEAAEAELSARTRALEQLRGQLDAGDDEARSLLEETTDRLGATEQQLAEARDRAGRAAAERDAALERTASSEQRSEVLDRSLADARDRIRRLEAELAVPAQTRSPATPSDVTVATTAPDPESCQPGEERDEQGFVFVRACAGTFTIGSPPSDRLAFDDEVPRHGVTLSAFWIGKYEVTNQEYRQWRPEHEDEDRLPASTVSWTQARKFCKHFGFDLPTEAEWEYAARAGTTTPWFFGDSVDDLDRYAWHQGNSGDRPHPVGERLPNPWGLHDVYGNVWEWVADMWAPYSPEEKVDPKGPPVTPGSRRMVRGGAFDDGPRLLRSAFRGGAGPVFRRRDVGFRCVLRPE